MGLLGIWSSQMALIDVITAGKVARDRCQPNRR
jgi:hypothetical protein